MTGAVQTVHSISRNILLLTATALLAGCLGQGDRVVEYRLRCVDEAATSLRECGAWATEPRIFFELDTGNSTVTRRVEDGPSGHYGSCTIHNTDHWTCAAEIGLPAIEFKQGRRVQGAQDQLTMQLSKRVTWFEWWVASLKKKLLG